MCDGKMKHHINEASWEMSCDVNVYFVMFCFQCCHGYVLCHFC